MTLVADGVLVVAALASGAGALLSWRYRTTPGSLPLGVFLAGVSLWSSAHLLEHHVDGLAATTAARLQWVGIIPLSFLWFAFVVGYTGRRHHFTRTRWAVLFAWPVALLALLWLPAGGPFGLSIWPQLRAEAGLVYWANVGLSYGLLAVGSILLVAHLWSLPTHYRRQGAWVFGGLIAAWLGSLVSVFDLFGDVHVHGLPIGFAVMGVALLQGVVSSDLSKVAPVRHRTVVQSLETGVLVADDAGRVTDLNPATRELLGLGPEEAVIGRRVSEVLPAADEFESVVEAMPPDTSSRRRSVRHRDRVLECEVSPLTDDRGESLGAGLLLADVTDQHERQAELERQRDRMEAFTEMVAHDLRNPLNVARARVDMASDGAEDPELAAADRAHQRMEDLIEDILTLARQDSDAIEAREIDLATVTERSWEHVATADADLVVEAEGTVEADPTRLRQLLENLIRNAVEHGGEDVTVTVGDLDDGFYVADDGAGIPDDRREEVFEPGYSTAEAGTGLGLEIVAETARTHGWEVDLRESEAGGARFEFRARPSD